MTAVTWCFDFISPYAYFGMYTLKRLPAGTEVRHRPTLLAGLLKHWGQKGPAEVPPKRVWTYRACVWWAAQNQIPFRMPTGHPFNSLPYLRLAVAAGNTPEAIRSIFTALWTTGADPADPSLITQLADALGVGRERLSEAGVKDALRENTDWAARRGVFGVPSLCIDEQVFWGNDAVDFAAAYLRDPGILATEEMMRAKSLPVSASRLGPV